MENTSETPAEAGGIGGQPVVDSRTGGQDMRLIKRAIDNGWPISPEIRKLVVNHMAIIVGKSEEDRSKIAAAKVLVSADGVNARREANEIEADKPPPTINVTQVVGVKEDEAWYSNDAWQRANSLASEATPASIAGPTLAGPNESNGVRPALGQNGHGPANGHQGPRPAPPPA